MAIGQNPSLYARFRVRSNVAMAKGHRGVDVATLVAWQHRDVQVPTREKSGASVAKRVAVFTN